MDAPYTELTPRKIFLYQYNALNNSYTTIDKFTIENQDDELKSDKWRENFITKLSLQKENRISQLDQWVGKFINSDDESLKSYDEIKTKIGWYELVISPQEINYHNDSRMASEFPAESPGGYIINYKCDYIISGDTIKLYNKVAKDSGFPKNLNNNTKIPVLTLFKKNDKYYGISSDIQDSKNLANSARVKNKSPYLFYKFNGN